MTRPLGLERRVAGAGVVATLGAGLRGLAQAACVTLVLVVLALFVVLAARARPSIAAHGIAALASTEWDPARERFGAVPFLVGTLLSSLLALTIAVPGGFLVALYVTEFAPRRLRGPVASLVEVLAAVPGIVYGLWGMCVLVPFVRDVLAPPITTRLGGVPIFAGPATGFGLLSAALVLALMALPTVAAVMRDVISSVPPQLREAGLALGGTRWEVMRHVVLPHARAGLFAAVMLGFGRALGETMAVAMVIGRSPALTASLFAPSHTTATLILAELDGNASPQHVAAISELALVLLVVTVAFNLGAHGVVRRTLRRKTAGLSTGPSEGELGEAP